MPPLWQSQNSMVCYACALSLTRFLHQFVKGHRVCAHCHTICQPKPRSKKKKLADCKTGWLFALGVLTSAISKPCSPTTSLGFSKTPGQCMWLEQDICNHNICRFTRMSLKPKDLALTWPSLAAWLVTKLEWAYSPCFTQTVHYPCAVALIYFPGKTDLNSLCTYICP